jgi:arylformamidase
MKIFLDYTQEELDRQYEHRYFVQDVESFVARAKAESRRVRAEAKGRFDVAYGAGADELVDIYLTDAPAPAPVIVFFHGGRWSRGSKASSCDGSVAFTEAGAHFVSVNYTLLPAITMDALIDQCRRAMVWIWNNAVSFGGDRDRLYVTGKSSGAHIGGMMVTTDWTALGAPKDMIKGGLLISGMYDLEPVRLTFRNDITRLDQASARRNSPIHRIPPDGCPLVVGCGDLETPEFRRHSKEFAAAWRAAGLSCRYMEVPDRHHYSVSMDMQDSPLVALMLEEMGLRERLTTP